MPIINCENSCKQAWREDRTLVAAAECIADALGQRYADSVPLSMEKTWAESSPKTPIICLLSPGEENGNENKEIVITIIYG